MFLLLFFGTSFGFSSNFRIICSACGAGKKIDFFNYNWRSQTWNLLFLMGAVIGGWLSSQFLSDGHPVAISPQTIQDLQALGFSAPEGIQPKELFSFDFLFTLKGLVLLVGGGFLVGFGSRYAGGCTSGHAISGLSALQLPSLLAVIGFFMGGLLTTHLLLPLLF